ncbi:MAG: pseudouridine-5'-phosphate glycosidase [Gemmataceae bacterium]|nr:pseudouridine-5'-phosphate glycosidase [Gemmataceae bacterium]
MTTLTTLDVHPDVATALRTGLPVVALESTLIAHGLPWPLNLETAQQAEAAVRAAGATPATIAVWKGVPTIGLNDSQREELARSPDVLKASRRDLAVAVSQQRTAATTVAATLILAHRAGIRLFATGGIGGAHRGDTADVSADLFELARVPVAVVCAGAKNILDLPRTLEILESLSVPVVGYATSEFPAFYVRGSGERLTTRVDTPAQAASLLAAHWALDGAGVILAQPLPVESALETEEFASALLRAEELARQTNVRGNAVTPFLLARLAELTTGKTLRANQALIVANARLAAEVATALAERPAKQQGKHATNSSTAKIRRRGQ